MTPKIDLAPWITHFKVWIKIHSKCTTIGATGHCSTHVVSNNKWKSKNTNTLEGSGNATAAIPTALNEFSFSSSRSGKIFLSLFLLHWPQNLLEGILGEFWERKQELWKMLPSLFLVGVVCWWKSTSLIIPNMHNWEEKWFCCLLEIKFLCKIDDDFVKLWSA